MDNNYKILSNDTCPRCSSTRIANIVYGYLENIEDLKKQIDEGEIVLGGCCVTGNDPRWHCNHCGFDW